MPGHIALHEPTDFFKALLETTQEGYWYIDNSLIGRDVNPALCRLLGRSRDDIIGRSIYDFVDEYNASVFRREIARRKHGTGSSYEITFSRPDGTDVHCLNNATPVFDETGEKVGSIGLWTDITRIKNIERELRISSRDLQRTAVDTDSKLAEAVRKLRRTEQHFHALMDNTPGAISLKDIEGRFYMVKPPLRGGIQYQGCRYSGQNGSGSLSGEKHERRLGAGSRGDQECAVRDRRTDCGHR